MGATSDALHQPELGYSAARYETLAGEITTFHIPWLFLPGKNRKVAMQLLSPASSSFFWE